MDGQLYFGKTLGVLLLSLLPVATLCGTVQAESVVRIGGTGSGLAVIKLLAKAYSKTHPGVAIKVVPSLGSSGGLAALTQGALELAVSARPLKSSESKTGTKALEFARTPFVFAVHKEVPKSDITTEELAGIYAGKTVTWSNGTFVRLILRPINDTDTGIVKSISPALAQAVDVAHRRPGMTVAATNDDSANALARVPGALAGTTLGEMIVHRRHVKILSYNGVKPSLQSLIEGKYPLVKRLYLVTPGQPSAAAMDFAGFVTSPQARDILKSAGSLPVLEAKGH